MLYFTQRHAADIAMRVGLCQQLAQLLSGQVPTAVTGIATGSFFALLLFFYSWKLALLTIFLGVFNCVISFLRAGTQYDMNAMALSSRIKLQAASTGGLIGIETLKASGGEDEFFRFWSEPSSRLFQYYSALGYAGNVDRLLSIFSRLCFAGFDPRHRCLADHER